MYCDFYGFKEKPFTVTPNPRFVFLSKNHREAFAHLLYGIDNHSGFIVLTGEIGTGKTTVLRSLLGQLDGATVRSALILNPCLSAPELLRSINREFGIAWEGLNPSELLDSLNRFLLAENRAGHTVALVIDEAQNLEPQVLEQIRLISNLETDTDKLIQIVLAGQPELGEILGKHELRQFKQRVAVRYHLMPMDSEDTREYIEHRLETAGGWRAANFSRGALRKIFRYSGGIPRLINIVCDRALLMGYIDETREISAGMAARAISEVRDNGRGRAMMRIAAGACLLAIITAAGVLYSLKGDPPVRIPVPPRPSQTVATPSSAVRDDLFAALEEAGEHAGAVAGFNALAKIWKVRPVEEGRAIPTPRALERLGEGVGLNLTRMEIPLDRLLSIDSPALLEVRVPGKGERRYLALIGRAKERFVVSPQLKGHTSLSRAELESLWSGKAYLPWRNFRDIPRLRPGMQGEAVTRLQELLREAGVYRGETTGVYDRRTTAAVVSFQSAHGVAKNGRPGKQTLFFLYRNGKGFPFPRLETTGGELPG